MFQIFTIYLNKAKTCYGVSVLFWTWWYILGMINNHEHSYEMELK